MRAPTLALVATIRDEGAHLAEWLAYHRAIGVDAFFLFDHESRDETPDILADWRRSGVWSRRVEWDGECNLQLRNLNEIAPALAAYDFAASLDADELLCPLAEDSITALLATLPDSAAGVVLNWRNFGERDVEGTSLLEITRCSAPTFPINRTFKSIGRTRDFAAPWWSAHRAPAPQSAMLHDFTSPFADLGSYQTAAPSFQAAQVNHYKWRSRAEFAASQARGDCLHRARPSGWTVEQWAKGTNVERHYRAKGLFQKLTA